MAKDPSLDHLVDYLAFGDGSATPVAWADTSLTVNLKGLADPEMRASARAALDVWTDTTGITFSRAKTAADISFDDQPGGAYANYSFWADGEIIHADVNVSVDWMDGFPVDQRWGVGDYGLQTFIHEIGHALGLKHGGPYDGSATYLDDAIFAKDTWKWSIMSYFDQRSDGSQIDYFISSPGVADVGAIERLYGPSEIRDGDDVYTIERLIRLKGEGTLTLVDTGGVDRFDFRGSVDGGLIDMRDGRFSTLDHDTPNDFAVALGTTIEHAIGSGETDVFTGNDADNLLNGGGSRDVLAGGAGNDTLVGGGGETIFGMPLGDELRGGAGQDHFVFAKTGHLNADSIADFKVGADLIDLKKIDADVTAAGNQAFSFVGAASFDDKAGELRYTIVSRETFLAGDTDGDGSADFQLSLNGRLALGSTDFIL